MGLVNDVFTDERLAALPGRPAIGHVRYSTAGDTWPSNAQPYLIESTAGPIAVGHNGNLVNAGDPARRARGRGLDLPDDLRHRGHPAPLRAQPPRAARGRDRASLSKVRGAYSLLFLTPDALVAARDPMGFRPLVLGRLTGRRSSASETCAFDLIDAEYVRDIEPGEMVVVDRTACAPSSPSRPSRPASASSSTSISPGPTLVFGRNVLASRLRLGRQLAREAPADADIVVPVPDSGMGAALGYAAGERPPLRVGLIRNHYVGRTFIEPKQTIRASA